MLKRLKEDIDCVFERDPAARNTLEILTTYPGIHAVLMHRLTHVLWKRNFKWPARVLSHLARWLTGIEIHPAACVGRRFFIDHGMGVVIGETAEIGNDCTLYHGVTLGGTTWEQVKRHPILGNNIVVGAGAKLLGPIHVGDEARIGSNAVVMRDVPAGATVVGIPGRVVVSKGDETHEKRERIAYKIGFDAYGATQEMPDPVANAINCLLDHIHAMDKKLEETTCAVKKMGGQVDDSRLPPIDPRDIEPVEPVESARHSD